MLQKIRNIRKRWLLVPAAAALLAVGIVGGAALAAGAGSPGYGPAPGFGMAGDYDDKRGGHRDLETRLLARVAEIVGVEAAALEQAFDTAFNEFANAEFAAKMNALAEDGALTEEQAAAAIAWFNGRPAAAGKMAFMAAMTASADKVGRMLERGVAKGYLTQEQADAIAAWHAERPDFIPERSHDRDRGRHHGKGKHDSAESSESGAAGDAG